MSRQDQNLEELIRLLYALTDYARLGMRTVTYNDCNNCGKRNCMYMPNPGEVVRINCPYGKTDYEEEGSND